MLWRDMHRLRSLIEPIQYPPSSTNRHFPLPYNSTLGIGVEMATFHSDGTVPGIYNHGV